MFASRRDEVEPQIVTALQKAGCSVDYAERKPYDLVIGRAGETYLLEVKTRKGRLRDSQVKFEKEWDGHYAIVRTAEAALKAVGL